MKNSTAFRRLLQITPPGSAAYVIIHGNMRDMQGLRLTCVFRDIRNPRLAFRAAWEEAFKAKK